MSNFTITGPSLALQQALFAHLSADAVLMAQITALVDVAPDDQLLPFVQLGSDIVSNASTKSYTATEHRIALDVWCAAPGRGQVKYLLELLRARLMLFAGPPAYVMPVWQFVQVLVLRDTDPDTHHGVIEFRARLVPA